MESQKNICVRHYATTANASSTRQAVYHCAYCAMTSTRSIGVRQHLRNTHRNQSQRFVMERTIGVGLLPDDIAKNHGNNEKMEVEVSNSVSYRALNEKLATFVEKTSTGELICILCSKVITISLKKHVLEYHLGVKQFSCKYCGESYREVLQVKEHISAVHPRLMCKLLYIQLDIVGMIEDLKLRALKKAGLLIISSSCAETLNDKDTAKLISKLSEADKPHATWTGSHDDLEQTAVNLQFETLLSPASLLADEQNHDDITNAYKKPDLDDPVVWNPMDNCVELVPELSPNITSITSVSTENRNNKAINTSLECSGNDSILFEAESAAHCRLERKHDNKEKSITTLTRKELSRRRNKKKLKQGEHRPNKNKIRRIKIRPCDDEEDSSESCASKIKFDSSQTDQQVYKDERKSCIIYECLLCDQYHDDVLEAEEHVRKAHFKVMRYRCEWCDEVYFETKAGLCVHFSATHPCVSMDYTDMAKELKTECRSNLREKERRYKRIETFECNQCDYTVLSVDEFREHTCEHLHYKPYECNFCRRRTTTKRKMARHLKKNHEEVTDTQFKLDTHLIAKVDKLINCCRKLIRVSASAKTN